MQERFIRERFLNATMMYNNSSPLKLKRGTPKLTYSVGPVLGLEVMGGIPVGVENDDGVGPGDIEPDAAHPGGQQEDENAGISIELPHNALPGGPPIL